MEILGTGIERPAAGRVRLVADVRYDAAGMADERYWIEVPEAAAADGLSAACRDPWLAALAPLAVELGEPLRMGPVDARLLEGVRALMLVWSGWYPGKAAVEIQAEASPAPPGAQSGESRLSASFFSGGVDSFFTVLSRTRGDRRALGPVDELILLHGFDIPLARPAEFARLRARLENAAAELGLPLQALATNLRQTAWARANWAAMAHGPALAAMAHALGHRYREVLIPSSVPYHRPHRAWGSHPLTDSLLSSSGTRMLSDGGRFRRIEKTAVVARSEIAARSLHVCWRERSAENCGRCLKCLRTLTILELLGLRDRVTAFPPDAFSAHILGRIHVEAASERRQLTRLVADAERAGRRDLAGAMRRSLRRSRWAVPLAAACRRAIPVPVLGGAAWRIERALLQDRPR